MDASSALRVLLVDDHHVFRRGTRGLLCDHGIEVVGDAGSGAEGVELALRRAPDVVVMDVSMPGMSGPEAVRELRRRAPGLPVVMLSASPACDDLMAAIGAGAGGYVLKDAPIEELLAAIRAAAAGAAMLSPVVAGTLVRQVHEELNAVPADRTDGGERLSEREREVLQLMTDGLDNGAIARRLFLSPRTVQSHVSHILAKLGVDNRVQAVVHAVRTRLVAA